ncbi:MAG: hypothetical protein LW715_05760 [Rhodobacter sp.]|jgi:hypothetical protein|nr:hypothetical protein [Rhodobacter sp.]
MDWSSFFSAALGGAIAIASQIAIDWWKERPKRQLDEKRKATLKLLLDPQNMPAEAHDGWRNIVTLQRVVGASEDDTKRLLVELGARGSTQKKDMWAMIANKPLPKKEDDE